MTCRDYKAFRTICFIIFIILLGIVGLGFWIKTNEQELLQQVIQAKPFSCPCKKKINQQPIILQSKETCHE